MTRGDSDAIPPSGGITEVVALQLEAVRAGASPERLAELEAKIAGAVRRSRSEATLAAYRSDWSDFETWCESLPLPCLPAEPGTVAAYLAELAEPDDDRAPLAMSTIQRRVAAIGEAHKSAGHLNPCADPLVKQVTKGIRRTLGVAPRHRKSGLSTADIRAIVTSLDGTRLIDVRDAAILLVGFATALRRSELVALEIEDVENHPEGVIVNKRRSKTDQEAAGKRIEVAYGEQLFTCPVRALRSWIDEADIQTGPIFRPVNRHGHVAARALSDRAVAQIIKKHVTRLGYKGSDYAGHSLRRGFSTEALRNGASERTIASTTHHTSTKGLQPYIEEADEFQDPPSRYLGL
ncbi:UNVERIFIED_CONTAM: hypothetical protein GTU68_007097 [Idotea baltica]|nr:hypothetical protein [Idotea baltica]